jgi:hypothetical protein
MDGMWCPTSLLSGTSRLDWVRCDRFDLLARRDLEHQMRLLSIILHSVWLVFVAVCLITLVEKSVPLTPEDARTLFYDICLLVLVMGIVDYVKE